MPTATPDQLNPWQPTWLRRALPTLFALAVLAGRPAAAPPSGGDLSAEETRRQEERSLRYALRKDPSWVTRADPVLPIHYALWRNKRMEVDFLLRHGAVVRENGVSSFFL